MNTLLFPETSYSFPVIILHLKVVFKNLADGKMIMQILTSILKIKYVPFVVRMQPIVRNQFPKFHTVQLAMGAINYIFNLIS